MNYQTAVNIFTKHELRAIAKARKLRWYSYLQKHELAFRLFSGHGMLNRALCQLNQLRRYRVPEPNDTKQWR
jgi:hypothetical protein